MARSQVERPFDEDENPTTEKETPKPTNSGQSDDVASTGQAESGSHDHKASADGTGSASSSSTPSEGKGFLFQDKPNYGLRINHQDDTVSLTDSGNPTQEFSFTCRNKHDWVETCPMLVSIHLVEAVDLNVAQIKLANVVINDPVLVAGCCGSDEHAYVVLGPSDAFGEGDFCNKATNCLRFAR